MELPHPLGILFIYWFIVSQLMRGFVPESERLQLTKLNSTPLGGE